MAEDMTSQVNTYCQKFEEGVEAGLNSAEDTKNWSAGNELGQELKADEQRESASESSFKEPQTPLFLRNGPGGNKGNAQDEKDETEE